MKNQNTQTAGRHTARVAAIAALAAAALLFVACEGPILVNVEDDVFRATSEKFAELVLRNGLTVVDPDSQVAFEDAAIGGLPKTENFSIQNTGDYPLELTSITFAGDGAASFTLEEPDDAVLQQEETTTFSVSFTPTEPTGLKYAEMIIAYRGGLEESTTFQLLGEAYGGELPELKLEFSSNTDPVVIGVSEPPQQVIAEEPVPFGSSVDYTFTVRNLGNQDLSLTEGGAKIVGTAGIFTVDNTGILTTVDSSTTFTVTADYSNPVPRGPKTVTIAVPNNDSTEGNIQFNFTVYAQAPELNVRLNGINRSHGSTASLYRNREWDGDWDLSFRVYNIKSNTPADAPLTFTTASPVTESTGGPDFVLSNIPAQGTTVAAGSSRSFTLTFQPSADGSYSSTVTILTDDPDESPYTVTVEITAGPPNLQVSVSIDGGGPTPVSEGETVYLVDPDVSLDVTVENPKAGNTTPLQLSVPNWHDDGDPSDFLGLPFEDDTWRGNESFAFEIGDLDALRDGLLDPGDKAEVRLSFNRNLPEQLFWKERVELHSNTFGDEVFTFYVATGNTSVIGVGNSEGYPAIWSFDPADGTLTLLDRLEETPGEIFGAFFYGDDRVRLVGTAEDTKNPGVYEAATWDFTFSGGRLENRLFVDAIADEEGASAIMDIVYDGRELYSGGFRTRDSLDPRVDWWDPATVSPDYSFAASGFDLNVLLDPVGKSAIYDVAARTKRAGSGSWNGGVEKSDEGEAYMWPNPRFAEPELIQISDTGALEAVFTGRGGTYFTLLAGERDGRASYWVYDEFAAKDPLTAEVSFGAPAAESRIFGTDEAGLETAVFAGVGDELPYFWTDPTKDGQVLGSGAPGIAFDVLNHVVDSKTGETGYVVAGRYDGRQFFWSSASGDPRAIVTNDGVSSGGEVNRLFVLTPMDFYRW